MSRKIEQKVAKEAKGLKEAAAAGDQLAQFMSRGMRAQAAVDKRSAGTADATGAKERSCRICGCTYTTPCIASRATCLFAEFDLQGRARNGNIIASRKLEAIAQRIAELEVEPQTAVKERVWGNVLRRMRA